MESRLNLETPLKAAGLEKSSAVKEVQSPRAEKSVEGAVSRVKASKSAGHKKGR